MTQKTLAKHLDEYTALAQQIAALEAQKQAVADKIKDAMLWARPRKCRQALIQPATRPLQAAALMPEHSSKPTRSCIRLSVVRRLCAASPLPAHEKSPLPVHRGK